MLAQGFTFQTGPNTSAVEIVLWTLAAVVIGLGVLFVRIIITDIEQKNRKP